MQITQDVSKSPGESFADRLQARVLLVEAAVDRFAASKLLVIACFSAIYFLPTAVIASRKLYWDDEFFTLYLSTLPSWHDLWHALATGADQHPPSFFYLTHTVINLLGCSPLTVRVPEIFGFWLMCVALYAVVRRLIGSVWGVFGMMLPLTTSAYYYASEARGYGLVLGFSALALYAWIELTAGGKRAFFIPLLGVSLAAAVASHYYAVIGILALCAGEAVRSIIRRRIDVAAWAAFAASAVPLLLFSAIIAKGREYATNFWAVPVWSDVFDFYPHTFTFAVDALLGSIGVLLLMRPWRVVSQGSQLNHFQGPAWNPWITTAVLALASAPLIAMILARSITHVYVERYALVAVIGASILVPCGLSIMYGRRTAGAIAAIFFCGMCFFMNQRNMRLQNQRSLADLRSHSQLLSTTGDKPVAVSDPTLFHRLSFYSRPDLYERLVYLVDRHAALEHLHADTVDRELLAFTPWFPLHTVPFQEFKERNTSFLAYSGGRGWLTYELPKISEDARLLAKQGDMLLLFVQLTPVRPASANADANPTVASEAVRVRSLCATYFGASHCPVL